MWRNFWTVRESFFNHNVQLKIPLTNIYQHKEVRVYIEFSMDTNPWFGRCRYELFTKKKENMKVMSTYKISRLEKLWKACIGMCVMLLFIKSLKQKNETQMIKDLWDNEIIKKNGRINWSGSVDKRECESQKIFRAPKGASFMALKFSIIMIKEREIPLSITPVNLSPEARSRFKILLPEWETLNS